MPGAQSFPKRERLQYGHQFRRVYDAGRRADGRCAVVFAWQPPAGETAGRAVGVVASRRVGGAVARNRARRLLREVYRRNKQKLNAEIQLVMVARAAINGQPYREVESALMDLFQAVGALAK